MNEKKQEEDVKAPRKKKTKIAYGMIIFVTLVIIGVASYGIYSMIHSSDEKTSTKTIKEINSELDDFFVQDSTSFIAASATEKNLTIIKSKIDDLSQSESKTELLSKYNDIKTRMTDISEVNALFEEPVIKGDKVSEDSILKEAKPITLMKFSNEDDLYDVLDEKIDEAKEQYKQIETLQTKIDKLYKDGELQTSDISQLELDDLRDEAQEIKNTTIRKQMEDTLDTIKSLLTGNGSSSSQISESNNNSSEIENSTYSQSKENYSSSMDSNSSSLSSSSSSSEEASSSSSTEENIPDDEVVVGEYNGVVYKGLGNSNRIFNTKEEAELFAKNEGSASQTVDYDIWQVRLRKDNSIKWTVNINFS